LFIPNGYHNDRTKLVIGCHYDRVILVRVPRQSLVTRVVYSYGMCDYSKRRIYREFSKQRNYDLCSSSGQLATTHLTVLREIYLANHASTEDAIKHYSKELGLPYCELYGLCEIVFKQG
jgi:hypothetical protein